MESKKMAQFIIFKQENTISILGNNVCLNIFREEIDTWDGTEIQYHLPKLTCQQVFQVLNAWNTASGDEDLNKVFVAGNNSATEVKLWALIRYLRYRVSREDFWDYNK